MSAELDLVIVGGGPAGLSTALHVLAAAPHTKLVVLEKERFPRDKICAGGIGARAFRILERIGVEVACPRVPLDALAIRVRDQTLVVREPGLGAVVRRFQFDHAFAEVARARGVEVRDGCGVERVEVTEDGVRLATSTGDTLQARAVIGADGIGGIVRRHVGFPRGELRAQVAELDTEAVPQDQPRDTIVFDFATRALHGYAWDFPTVVDGAPLVCRGVYVLKDGGAADDPVVRMRDYLAVRGLDLARYKLKRFAERGLEPGTALSRPRVLLVGEAAGIDIATGEGIGQAIEYGALAGPYLANAFAKADFGFADWRATIERRHLGKQFRIRHACYRAFYGPQRDTVERLLPRIASLVRVGCQDFAGVPLSKLALARGAGQFLAAMTREVVRR